jgi:geranylgeranylglycerol-phosphate geranylgeranyltransferase
MRDYISICRPVNALITFIAVLLGAVVASKSGMPVIFVLLASLSAAVASAAGNVINDIFDIATDKINRPDRPLPSGRIGIDNAIIFYCMLLILSVAASVPAGKISVLIVFVSNLLLFIYSWKLKRIVLAGNIAVAFLTALAFIYGSVVVGKPEASVFPALFAFIINFMREIVKDAEDIEGDKSEGVKTFPQIMGFPATLKIAWGLTAVLICLILTAGFLRIYKIEFLIIAMCIVSPVMVYCMKQLRSENFHKVSILLKINMLIGLAAIYLGRQ